MLKNLALIMMFLPTHALAEATDAILQSIFDDYQTQCVAAQADFRHIDYEEDDPVIADLSLPDDSIYEITITADGQTATVLYANFRCTNIGSAWCGSSGCTSYVIIDGTTFQTEGFKPVSLAVSEDEVPVIVPRSGGSCLGADGRTLSSDASCYAVAVWDDVLMAFNSLGSSDPIFKISD